MDLRELVEGFPLKREGWIYLDSAATSLKHDRVIEAVNRALTEFGANVGRSLHPPGERATEEYENARERVARFLGVEPETLAFTLNATHAIHIVAASIDWNRGDAVVTTKLEHHSNVSPWLKLAEKLGLDVRIVGFEPETGTVNLGELEAALDDDVKLVAITHESNALGSVQPVDEVLEMAEEVGAYVLLDAAQSMGVIDEDWDRFHFVCAPGHKGLLGPHGTGVLIVREDVVEELDPWTLGGGSTARVEGSTVITEDPPHLFESGTPNVPGVVGLAEGVSILEEVGLENVEDRVERLTRRAVEGLEDIDGVEVLAPEAERKTIVPFVVEGMDHGEVGRRLAEERICIRTGTHCASTVFEVLGLDGCARASMAFYNDEEEVDRFLEVVEDLARRTGY
ncbi:MAG: aminotransferase class V-fold PLP-dependent enzyme [Methanopyri archaeon]|nr:aminotransferase class V-fold PLP-dependent enzyme [Methanopyri archaeon]